MKWPLLRVVLPYVAGILLGNVLVLSPLPLLGASLCLALAALALTRWRVFCLYPLILFTGWTNICLRTFPLSPHDLRRLMGAEPQLVTVRGALHETPSLRVFEQGEAPSWRTLARIDINALRLNKADWQPASGRMAVSTPGMLTNLFAGQTVEITGVAMLPRLAAAEGTFDYRAFLRQQGIYYQLQAESEQDWQILFSPARPPLADRFRNWARAMLARGLPIEDESLRLEWALTLGWKPALTEEVSEPFIQAATYHIFAVDGLRMAIVFGILFTLLRAFRVPRPVCGLVLVPAIWFYVALTGWPASAIRATVMLTIIIIGWTLKRPTNLINSLLAAALIILLWQPQQIFQAGFQLSFVVVLFLILMLPPLYTLVQRLTSPDPLLPSTLQRHYPAVVTVPVRYCADLFLTSFAAWVGSIPLVAYYFHIITPVSTPANVIAVPLCALVLVSNLASLLLAGWFPAAAELFNHAGWFLMEGIRISSHWFANWPKAYFYVAAPSLVTASLYYCLLLALLSGWLLKPTLRAWKFSAAGLAVLVGCGLAWHNSVATRLTILPVNGGTAIYFDAVGSSNDLLLDCGNTNAVQSLTKPFLRAQGVNRIQTLALTHGDLHHVGGAEIISDLFPTRHICASPVRFRSTAYRRALRHFNATPNLFRTISRNQQLGPWTVLHPEPADRFPQADDNALVLRADFNGSRILLLSDLGRPGQNALLDRTNDLQADIVVAGLPSTTEALCDALLDAVQPRVIIVADSEFPASERSSPKLRERLAQRHIPVIYTRFAGAATIELRRKTWEIRTMNGLRLTSRDSNLPNSPGGP